METRSNPLIVYSASAGSGKTYTLALQYIKLLIQNPDNYRYILAVTFTNKATGEMKSRILSKLYGLANGLESSADYMDELSKAFPKMTPDDIRRAARLALNNLLDHYNWFRVETIDSFFQSVMRSLARELGLTANLNVGLNDKEVEEKAVDNVIDNITSKNDPVLKWIMDYVYQQLANNRSWNVIGKFKSFSQILSKEFYQKNADKLHEFQVDDAKANSYRQMLISMETKANATMNKLSKDFFKLATDNGMEAGNFYQTNKGVWGLFTKLGKDDKEWADPGIFNSYVNACIDQPEKLIKKGEPAIGREAFTQKVLDLIEQVQKEHATAALNANTAHLTLGNLNELKLLSRIGQEVNRINTETNSYLLSNTQNLLSTLIKDSDSPFIYEKIGGELRYIMIDEFQDTSGSQWNNFKVLLEECLSHDTGSLIVGDVKQSIYRWRSGDWRILNQLSQDKERCKGIPLDTNYRSEYYIIHFNNDFFQQAAKCAEDENAEMLRLYNPTQQSLALNHKIGEVYGNLEQLVPEKKRQQMKGSVVVKMIDSDDMDSAMIEAVKNTVKMLIEQGNKEKDIAIIVRRNDDIKRLAEYFQQNEVEVNGVPRHINMVSDEAFRLDSSLAVCTIINAMRLLANPDDELTRAALVKAYQEINGPETSLPDAITFDSNQLLSKSLIDLAEKIYSLFSLSRLKDEASYVCTFFDAINNFTQDHVPDIQDFLNEWDNNLCSTSITSDNVDGIRMLTIHKAKGLEFPNVIVPYCDWDIEKKDDLIWVEPQVAPFNALPVVPVALSAKRLLMSYYKDDYLNEHVLNIIDSLNLLYVAFTRARCRLFVFGKLNKPQYPSKLLQQVMEKLTKDKPEEKEEDADGKSVTYYYGLRPNESLKKDDAEKDSSAHSETNVFEPEEESQEVALESHNSVPKFKQSNASTEFIMSDDNIPEKERLQYIKTGNLIHSVLANIRYAEDLPRAVAQLDYDGCLFNREVSREELLYYLEERLDTPQAADWFSHRWPVVNERTILTLDTSDEVKAPRPDRVITDGKGKAVVIDFKTGEALSKHHQQVAHYMQLLCGMGYHDVEGYLWYLNPNQIVKVNL
jgi:ATP-dependent exoDNAse (exonuclease V) beta subunit